jgi:Cysteine dioxygenase type I
VSAPTPTPQEGRRPGPPLRCLPGRSVHPSGQTSPGLASENHVRNRPTGALSFGALRAIAAGMARVYQPLPAAATHPGEVSSVRLLRTAFYDAWLVTWPVGSELEPHDHGPARSVLHVIDGELVEYRSDREAAVTTSGRRLLRGGSTFGAPSLVHELVNRSGAEATTLHVYSPPLEGITVATRSGDPSPGGSRRAEDLEPASAAGATRLPRLVAPPLALVEGCGPSSTADRGHPTPPPFEGQS